MSSIDVRQIDHVGIRVKDLDRAMAFYRVLGFQLVFKASEDAVAIVKNEHDVELNLIYNANADADAKNILMDVAEKYPGYTHIALRVESIKATIETLQQNNIRITQGPVSFGQDGHVSVFVRDPDLNVIEFRGREENLAVLPSTRDYRPEN